MSATTELNSNEIEAKKNKEDDKKKEEDIVKKANDDNLVDVDKKPIRVKKWNATAQWGYDIENDTCAICHSQITVPCILCDAEPKHSDECTACFGECGHTYHFHCISQWLKTRSTCPLDDVEWEFVQY